MFRDGFSIRPHLDDMTRLKQASGVPLIASSIQHITVFLGDTEPIQFRKSIKDVGWFFGHAWGGNDDNYGYGDEWGHCESNSLSDSLSNLDNLTSITAASLQCPFEDRRSYLAKAWHAVKKRELHAPWVSSRVSGLRYCSEQYVFTRNSDVCYKELTSCQNLVPILRHSNPGSRPCPLSLFNLPDTLLALNKAVAQVQNLRIVIREDDTLSVELSSQHVKGFFASMTHLKDLDLTWHEQNPRSRSSDTTPLPQLTILKQSILHIQWPLLQKLSIRGTAVNLEFVSFLNNRTSTLKYLNLKRAPLVSESKDLQDDGEFDCELEGRPYEAFFTSLRTSLNLLEAKVVFLEFADYQAVGPMDDATWDSSEGEMYALKTKLLEWFVLGQSEWPFNEDSGTLPSDWTMDLDHLRSTLDPTFHDCFDLLVQEHKKWLADISE